MKNSALRRVPIIQTIVAGKDCDSENSVVGGAGSESGERIERELREGEIETKR